MLGPGQNLGTFSTQTKCKPIEDIHMKINCEFTLVFESAYFFTAAQGSNTFLNFFFDDE